jgi:hypothetical protein
MRSRRPSSPLPASPLPASRLPGLAAALAALALAGCAVTLQPAPGATTVSGPGRGATAEAHGVRAFVHAGAWRGFPAGLEADLTPMLLTVDNGSGRPLRLRYEHVALEGPGDRATALPPFEITGTALIPVDWGWPYAFGPSLAWHHRRGRFWYDPFYPDHVWGPSYVSVALPTGDMVQKALAEGPLEPGGRRTGFVYFPAVAREAGAVDVVLELVDATSGERFGAVRVPFVVR